MFFFKWYSEMTSSEVLAQNHPQKQSVQPSSS